MLTIPTTPLRAPSRPVAMRDRRRPCTDPRACRSLRGVLRIPPEHHWVFWELDPDEVDADAHADYVMARILEFGGLAEVQWLIGRYGMPAVHRFLRDVGDVEISERTKRFWRAVFRAKDETWADPGAWRKRSDAPWIA